MARVPLNFNSEGADRSFEEYMAQPPKVSETDAAVAALDLAWHDTAVGLYARSSAIKELESGGATKLSPVEANKLYPGMPTPFREPVNPYVAQMLYDTEKEKAELQWKISRGPTDGWSKTKQFGVGLLAHALDPAEFGVGAVAGWGVGGAVTRGVFGTRLAQVAGRVAAGEQVGAAARVGYNVAEAGAGNLIENTLQEGYQTMVENTEGITPIRSTGEIINDIAISTFAGTALGTGIKEVSFQLNSLKRIFRETSPEADLINARQTLSALETEMRPDGTPLIKALSQETSVLPQDFGKPAYTYEPIDLAKVRQERMTIDDNPDFWTYDEKAKEWVGEDGTRISDDTDMLDNYEGGSLKYNETTKQWEDVPKVDVKKKPKFSVVRASPFEGKQFYGATRDSNVDFKTGSRAALGDDFGFGTHVSDNPGVANAAAARSLADSTGAVHEVEISPQNTLDLDQPLPREGFINDEVRTLLNDSGVDEIEYLLETATMKDLFMYVKRGVDNEFLDPAALDLLQEAIKKDGFDSMKTNGSSVNGFEHAAHNHVIMLDDTKISASNAYKPDARIVRQPTDEDVRAASDRNLDPNQKIFADPENFQRNKDRLESVKAQNQTDTAKVRRETEELIAELESQSQQGLLQPEDIKFIERIKENVQRIEDQHTLLKAFASCVRA